MLVAKYMKNISPVMSTAPANTTSNSLCWCWCGDDHHRRTTRVSGQKSHVWEERKECLTEMELRLQTSCLISPQSSKSLTHIYIGKLLRFNHCWNRHLNGESLKDKERSVRPPVVVVAKIFSWKAKGKHGQCALRKLNGKRLASQSGIPELYTGVLRIYSHSAEWCWDRKKMVETRSEAIFMKDCAPSHTSRSGP